MDNIGHTEEKIAVCPILNVARTKHRAACSYICTEGCMCLTCQHQSRITWGLHGAVVAVISRCARTLISEITNKLLIRKYCNRNVHDYFVHNHKYDDTCRSVINNIITSAMKRMQFYLFLLISLDDRHSIWSIVTWILELTIAIHRQYTTTDHIHVNTEIM